MRTFAFANTAVLSKVSSAEDRLPESQHFAECEVILGVVRVKSVHKAGYGHKWERAASAPLVA
jgi:hypothetical protein